MILDKKIERCNEGTYAPIYALQMLGISLHIRCCVPYIAVLPKWLLVFVGSSHMLTELSSENFMLIGTSFTGPSFIVTVDVP